MQQQDNSTCDIFMSYVKGSDSPAIISFWCMLVHDVLNITFFSALLLCNSLVVKYFISEIHNQPLVSLDVTRHFSPDETTGSTLN